MPLRRFSCGPPAGSCQFLQVRYGPRVAATTLQACPAKKNISNNIAELAAIGKARSIFNSPALAGDSLEGLLKKPASIGRTTEERTDKLLHPEVEFHDHAVGTAREAEARSDVVFDAIWERAPDDRKDVVLLRMERRSVVEVAGTAVELDPGREVARPTIVGAVAIAELEALIVSPPIQRLLENWIQYQGDSPEVLLDDGL